MATARAMSVAFLFLIAPIAMAQESPDWLATISAEIAESEYHVTWQRAIYLDDLDEAWQAPNRAHDLRTYFTPEGIRVVPRRETEPAWELGLFLGRWGRSGDLIPVGPASRLTAEANRIEHDRGAITEWYVNGRDGLEQGFTIAEDPMPADSRPLLLEIAVRGGLRTKPSGDGQAVEFLTRDGRLAVRYSKLVVEDAAGRRLDAHIEVFSASDLGGLRLVIDDRDALYPIVVDPLLTTASWSAESDQAESRFGEAVATAGDVNGDGYSDVIVGARLFDSGQLQEGRAYVYHGSASGLSTVPDWIGEVDVVSAFFGKSVATAGDVNGDGYSDVIVGADAYTNGESGEGAAFVFHGSATGLGAAVDWSAEMDQVNAAFGQSVATAGDVNGDGYSDVIVGALWYDNNEDGEGGAFVYHGSASGLGETPAWIGEMNQPSARFGYTVSTAGDVNGDGYSDVIVGSDKWQNGQVDEGAVFVYHGSATGLPATPDWSKEENQGVSNYGATATTAGDVNGDGYSDVIVGAGLWDVGGQFDRGRVFVYYGSSTGLSAVANWIGDGPGTGTYYGGAVGTAGDVNGDGYSDVMVGASQAESGGSQNGRVYVYYGGPTGVGTNPWAENGDQDQSLFGRAVATAGDVNGDGYSDIVVGAYLYDNGSSNEGRAFVYHGGADGIHGADFQIIAPTGHGRAGESVASAGDVNGDGYADIMLGAPTHDMGVTGAGGVFVYLGSPAGAGGSPSWSVFGQEEFARMGSAVGSAGDVNGDGYSDIIFSAPLADHGPHIEAGKVWIVLGSENGLPVPWSPTSWTLASSQSFGEFGFTVGSAGDVDGDGYSDVFVGEPNWVEGGNPDSGAIRVYRGSASGVDPSALWSATGESPNEHLGRSADTAGDVNGDGYSDLIVGRPELSQGGQAMVFHGSVGGLSATADWIASCPSGPAGIDFFGTVASAGDLNGDGFGDVVAGGGIGPDCNDIFVYYGSATGLSPTVSWQESTGGSGHDFAAGDFNGDGYSDLVLGDPSQSRVEVWYGAAAGLTPGADPDWQAMAQGFLEFGFSVASAGDVDGDGVADMFVGAPGFPQTVLYVSGSGETRPLRPRQLRSWSDDPIDRLGRSDAVDAFRIETTGYAPLGRGDVALEYEVKPYGTPFDGTNTTTTPYVDVTGVGHKFDENVVSLAEETAYHWRARLRYAIPTSPFRQYGRWFSQPWNDSASIDFRTDGTTGAGAVPADDSGGGQLILGRTLDGKVQLSWGSSCLETDEDFAVYMGDLGDFDSMVPETCSTGGLQNYAYPPDPINVFYIVVPVDIQSATEGSYGADSGSVPRLPAEESCFPQVVEAVCE